jgi:hypothetical protein
MPDMPLSPAPVTAAGPDYLPAYLSNGVIGLRVRDIPLFKGVAVVNGLAGEHPVTHVECTPHAPYPLAGDLKVGGMALSDFPACLHFVDQRYDFGCGELTSRFRFRTDVANADVEVLTFCSRSHPLVVAQRVTVTVDARCAVEISAKVDPRDVPGRWRRRYVELPGQEDAPVDGALEWETLGGTGRCGVAYSTSCDVEAERSRATWDDESPLVTRYTIDARRNRPITVTQLTALVPNLAHDQPHLQAIRSVAHAAEIGFDRLQEENRTIWDDLWRGRVRLLGADDRWQAMVDAAFYYLNASVHASSLAATHIFGLAQWLDYHYYFGHVMWDIEAFAVPALLLTQPGAAESILDYRFRNVASARQNARMNGRRGLQFPWQSSPTNGQEAAPGGGRAAADEHHVTPNVALAFARYVYATGDDSFDRDRAWPVLSGAAEWVESRVVRTHRGFEIKRATGIAEREQVYDNSAYVNVLCKLAVDEAIHCARRVGRSIPPTCHQLAADIVVPIDPDTGVIQDHDDFDPGEEKGATPAALAALFPAGHSAPPDVEEATLRFYLARWDEYVGSPMLSALYPSWALRLGDRRLAAKLLEEGYAKFTCDRFMNVHEYRGDRFPEEPVSGPFIANLSGLLLDCYYGFTGIEPGEGPLESWARRPVVMPAGWEGVEVESLWARGGRAKLVARHGDERARLDPH